MDLAIQTRSLTKFYGKTRGIEGLDLEIFRGEVFGYLGPNGAGKSTTIRLLLDLIRRTSGTAQVLGMDSHADARAIREKTGYLPGELALYESLTGRQLLAYLARLRNMEGLGAGEELARRLQLDLNRPIRSLSRGNKQKVGVIQAFMHSPELLILDEPTSGLDPLVQHEFHALISEATAHGATVLLSSHVLSEIEHMTHRVGIIRNGRLVAVEEIEALKEKAVTRIDLRFGESVALETFQNLPGVRSAELNGQLVSVQVEGSVDAVVKAAARFDVIDLRTHEPDLEEIFLAYYKDDSDAA